MTFYPNQGNIVIGSDQLTASFTSAGSDLSGDIHPNVEKTGTLEFIMPQGKRLWLGKVNKIEFHFGNLWDGSYNMREVSLTLPVS